MTPNEQSHAAGELILAVEADDAAAALLLIRRFLDGGPGVVGLVWQLAGIAAHYMREAGGDSWRDQLSHALLDLETRGAKANPENH